MIHHAWSFLTLPERRAICNAFPVFVGYASLRKFAISAPVHVLREQRVYSEVTDLCQFRLQLMSAALLRFHFSVADLARWLGGEYTQDYLDYDALEAFLQPTMDTYPRPGQPPIDIVQALRVWREGSPLSGDFWCRRADLYLRNLQNNHPPAHEHSDLIRQDIIADEAASFNLVVYRWMFRFIPGIHLALANIVFRKGKSRQIIDPSSRLFQPIPGQSMTRSGKTIQHKYRQFTINPSSSGTAPERGTHGSLDPTLRFSHTSTTSQKRSSGYDIILSSSLFLAGSSIESLSSRSAPSSEVEHRQVGSWSAPKFEPSQL